MCWTDINRRSCYQSDGALIVATRQWVGVDKKNKKQKRALIPFFLFFPAPDWRPESFPPDPCWGGLWWESPGSQAGFTSGSQTGERGSGWGPFWAGGGWYPRTPALFLLQVKPAIAGGPPLPVPEGSRYPLDEPQLKKTAEIKPWTPHQAPKRKVDILFVISWMKFWKTAEFLSTTQAIFCFTKKKKKIQWPCCSFSSSHTSLCCWRWLSCRYNENTTGLNFIDIVATLKCSNLILPETEGFQP